MLESPLASRLVDKRTPAGLATLFAAVLGSACGGSVVGTMPDGGDNPVGSSSSSSGGTDSGVPGLETSLCDSDGYAIFRGLNPAVTYDYIEYRSVYGEAGIDISVFASDGEACKTASDKPGCLGKLATVSVTAGFETLADREFGGGRGDGSIVEYMVLTRGDEVTVIGTDAEVLGLLGPIDTLKEAAFVLAIRGQQIVCPPSEPHSTGEALASALSPSDPSYRLVTFAGHTCGEGSSRDALISTVAGNGTRKLESRTVIEKGDPGCAVGRRPDGLLSRAVRGKSLGAFFAEVAHLEAASVTAFEQIEAELVQLGAPRVLRRGARRARADEIRHARSTTALARRFGSEPAAPCVERQGLRTRFQLALDNAIEGCVKETFGALVAQLQAERAADPEIAEIMQAIAREETEHAAFSWKLAAWLEAGLTAEERTQLEAARQNALVELEAALSRRFEPEVEQLAGMPTPEQAQALLAEIAPYLAAA